MIEAAHFSPKLLTGWQEGCQASAGNWEGGEQAYQLQGRAWSSLRTMICPNYRGQLPWTKGHLWRVDSTI